MEKKIEVKAIVTKDWLSQLEVCQKNKSVYLYMNSYWIRPCKPKEDQVLMNVTLSPACLEPSRRVQSQELDHKAMWETAKEYYEAKRHVWSATDRVADKLLEIEAKHTPQGDQTGVKEEER